MQNFIFRFTLIFSAILLTIPHLAFAGDQNDGEPPEKSWFFEGRYQKSLFEATGFNDATTDNTRNVSATGESFDKLDSAGFAVGRFFNEGRVSLSLGYETFGTVNKKFATTTTVAGAVSNDVVLPMDISNIMFELSYNAPITADMFAIGLIGLGQSTISSKQFSIGATTGLGVATEAQKTSSRLGIGLGYDVSDKVQIIGLVQSSKYGDSNVNTNTVANPTPFTAKVDATEASIRIRVAF